MLYSLLWLPGSLVTFGLFHAWSGLHKVLVRSQLLGHDIEPWHVEVALAVTCAVAWPVLLLLMMIDEVTW